MSRTKYWTIQDVIDSMASDTETFGLWVTTTAAGEEQMLEEITIERTKQISDTKEFNKDDDQFRFAEIHNVGNKLSNLYIRSFSTPVIEEYPLFRFSTRVILANLDTTDRKLVFFMFDNLRNDLTLEQVPRENDEIFGKLFITSVEDKNQKEEHYTIDNTKLIPCFLKRTISQLPKTGANNFKKIVVGTKNRRFEITKAEKDLRNAEENELKKILINGKNFVSSPKDSIFAFSEAIPEIQVNLDNKIIQMKERRKKVYDTSQDANMGGSRKTRRKRARTRKKTSKTKMRRRNLSLLHK